MIFREPSRVYPRPFVGRAPRGQPLGDTALGLSPDILPNGYLSALAASDGKTWRFTGADDVAAWLSAIAPDPRQIFTDDDFLPALLKWLGEPFWDKARAARTNGAASLRVGGMSLFLLPSTESWSLRVKGATKIITSLAAFTRGVQQERLTAMQVAAHGQELLDALAAMGVEAANLYSVGGIFAAMAAPMLKRDAMRLPPDVSRLAYDAYHTNWVTNFRLGTSQKAWDYDISSAYPSEAAQLVNTSPLNGDWIEGTTPPTGWAYGICRGVLDIRKTGPILVRLSPDADCQGNCTGMREQAFMAQEKMYLEETGRGKATIERGFWFVPKHDDKPLGATMRQLFAARARAKAEGNVFMANVWKGVSVAAQGQFVSAIADGSGLVQRAMFNPVYADQIVANTRIKVARLALEHETNLLHIVVDGVCADAPLLPNAVGASLPGDWHLAGASEGEPFIAAGDADYHMPSRDSCFSRDVLEEYRDKDYYEKPIAAPMFGYLEAPSFEDVGRVTPDAGILRVALRTDNRQRTFGRLPRTCADLLKRQYESGPTAIELAAGGMA